MLLVACTLLLAGCKEEKTSSGAYSVAEQKRAVLEEKIQVDTLQVEQTEEGNVLVAQVTLPDYSSIFRECDGDIVGSAFNAEEYEKLLYEAAANRVTARDGVTYDVAVELPEKEIGEWQQKELRALATQTAMDKEIQEYCMEYILEQVPLEVEGE